MAQLIENKPPRRALIATLWRFCPYVPFAPRRKPPARPPYARSRGEHQTRLRRRRRATSRLSLVTRHLPALMQRSKEGPLTTSSNLQLLASSLKNLIDTASRLEINLTAAESTQTPFLIVAEMRLCKCDFRARNFRFRRLTGPRRRRHSRCAVSNSSDGLNELPMHRAQAGSSVWPCRRCAVLFREYQLRAPDAGPGGVVRRASRFFKARASWASSSACSSKRVRITSKMGSRVLPG